jgi:membrane associated rhomboid family serine protease
MHSPFVPGRSQRLKWWWEDLRAARFSWSLAALLLVVEAGLSSLGGTSSPALHPVYEGLGLNREGIAKGWLWQIATHGVIHGGWGHVLVNVLFLVGTGARVERIAGAKAAARIFASGTLFAGAAFLLLPSAGLPLVGASGGIFALLLWLTAVSPQSRMAPLPVSARNLGLGILLASGILAAAAPWVSPGHLPVSHACHFGGAVTGWWLARRSLKSPVTKAELEQERARRESAGGL